MNDFKCNISTRGILKNSKDLCLFTGAGISYSYPGNNPLSYEIVDSIIKLLFSIINSKENSFSNRSSLLYYKINKSPVRLEVLFDILKRILGEKVLNCFADLNYEYPNLDHLYLAKLCEIRNIKNIFTLNFDLLHEKSFSLLGIDYQSFDSLDFPQIKNLNKKHNIYHLHGVFTNLQNLAIGVMDVGSAMNKTTINPFKKSIAINDILCCGYSDNDPDTFPIIANSPRKIFWYLYNSSEKIPYSVSELNKQNLNFNFIERIPSEKYLYNSLLNIFPELVSSKKEIYNIFNKYSDIRHKSINDRVKTFCRKITDILSNDDESNINIAKYVLGCLLYKNQEFVDALELFNEINPNNPLSYLSFYTKQSIAGIYEFIDNPKNSFSCWQSTYKIFKNTDIADFRERSKVRLAKAELMIWKRNPSQFHYLLKGFTTLLQITTSKKPDIYTISYLAIAELFHFLSEYFFFQIIEEIIPIKNPYENSRGNRLLYTSRNCFYKIIEASWLRFFLLYISGFFYKLLVADDLTGNYQYQFLAQLRLYEIYSALSDYHEFPSNKLIHKLNYTKYEMDTINKYYQWANIKNGICNSDFTLAVMDFYKNHNSSSLNKLINSKEKYKQEKMKSGIKKCKIYIDRLNVSNV